MRASSEFQLGAPREVVARERQGHCHGESGSPLSVQYILDLARAGGSSIVDEPGEC